MRTPIVAGLWQRLRGHPSEKPPEEPCDSAATRCARCAELERRLHWCDQQLRERTERLYALEQQYSKEHFTLYESLRDLKTERLRNAGAYSSLDTILARAKELQERIRDLKVRLRRYEDVEDRLFESEPIFIETGRTE
jgi:hypothetical protein